MKKVIIGIVVGIFVIAVLNGCVIWYNVATFNYEIMLNENDKENQTETQHQTKIEKKIEQEIELKVEKDVNKDKEENALFTLENYPKVDASLAIHPLVQKIAADFLNKTEEELDYEFEYTTGRSSEVYRNLIDGKVDVIVAAEISEEDKNYAREKGVELDIVPLTSSAFVFIVNKNNAINGITFEEAQKIYTGEITNWKEIGGNDAPIIAYQRPTGSGSQTAMLSLVMKDEKMMVPPQTQIRVGMGELVDVIAEYENSDNAIGYSYFYYINTMYKKENIKMLSIDGVYPSIETIKNNTYPIYTNGFLVTRKNISEGSNTEKWVNAILSERGSKIIEEAGYVPVN